MHNFDATEINLNDINLIEASAGTGKTFAISILYLRAILNDFGDSSLYDCKPIHYQHILVVTFTNAATQELRERLKEKLIEAKHVLLGETQASLDPVLTRILQRVTNKTHALAALNLAIAHMDQAEIHTIHAFCQKLLKRHSFDMNLHFHYAFQLDDNHFLTQGVQDFWRNIMASLERPFLDLLFNITKITSPFSLEKQLKKYRQHSHLIFQPDDLPETVSHFQIQLQQSALKIKNLWYQEQAREAISQCFAKNTKQGKITNLDRLDTWLRSDTNLPVLNGDVLDLSPWQAETIKEKAKKPIKDLTVFTAISEYNKQLKRTLPILLRQALRFCGDWLVKLKEQQQIVTADDLLNKVNSAIYADTQQNLTRQIATAYPIVFIDEFQDTDSVQYAIFRSLFHQARHKAVFYIGDPKQAIYSFRGADINTYLRAKSEISSDKLFTLNTNWRATPAMVEVTNAIFSLNPTVFDEEHKICYQQIQASSRYAHVEFIVQQYKQPALSLINVETETSISNKEQFLLQGALHTSAQIAQWLVSSEKKETTLGGKPLNPNDIAVLVRNGNEAQAIQQALAARGINSSFLSKNSVFNTNTARDLYWILASIIEPLDTETLIAAVSSSLFGYNLVDLQTQLYDEPTWLLWVQRFHYAHENFLQFGPLTALLHLESELLLGTRWLKRSNGKTIISEFHHLAECIEEQYRLNQGMESLKQWYLQKLDAPEDIENGERARMSNDETAITITTIHASKGLEYPIVCLPYISSGQPASEPLYFDKTQKTLVYDADVSLKSMYIAEQERLAEDVRLLYVAITRAKFHCSIVNMNDKQANCSAWYQILSHLNHKKIGETLPLLTDLTAQMPHKLAATVQIQSPALNIKTLALQTPQTKLTAKPFTPRKLNPQLTLSYTSLAKTQEHHIPIEKVIESAKTQTMNASPSLEDLTTFTFPKGAKVGILLHNILEKIDFTQASDNWLPIILSHLKNIHLLPKLELNELANFMKNWLETLVTQPLAPMTFTLADIHDDKRLNEMEFLLSCHETKIAPINQLMHQYGYPKLAIESTRALNGFLKGFIDCIILHEGQFALIDYKSNYLGNNYSDYAPENLLIPMRQHDYQLQYIIYCVAFYRWATLNYRHFDYDNDFIGIYYLFIRGTQAHGDSGIFFDKPPLKFIHKLHELLLNSNPQIPKGE
ncbi:MAG: exodeoxyribonuclease V subunit beta [Pseudomonadota bacterium]